ncbi:helix-turn-helix domain-containing protein [bacterium]|nr:helix-turn-helix domain-containing protein [candidate division CSSED10-310 bacterium]
MKQQLQLFPQPKYEVNSRGERLLITYRQEHTVSIPKHDRVLVKYEMARMVRSGIASRQEVAELFAVNPHTVSIYCHAFEVGGLEGLREFRGGGSANLQRQHGELYEMYRKYPGMSARKLHRRLSEPGAISFYTVSRLLGMFRKGYIPGRATDVPAT